jgi:hypothetical protein
VSEASLDPEDLAVRLRAELADVDTELPPDDLASIRVLVDAGEWVVALETLCTQIYEYDVTLRSAQRSSLTELGRALGVPVPYLLGDPWASRDGADDSCD